MWNVEELSYEEDLVLSKAVCQASTVQQEKQNYREFSQEPSVGGWFPLLWNGPDKPLVSALLRRSDRQVLQL